MSSKISNFKVVFFCSAYNDISFILAEIEHKVYENCLVYVTNNIGAFQFLKTIPIKGMELEFLESKLKNNSNPIHWLKEVYNVHVGLYFKFKAIKNSSIYFHATYYDTISMYAAGQLKNDNKLYLGFLPEADEFIENGRRFYDRVISVLYKVPIHTFKSVGVKVSGLSENFLNKFILKARDIPSLELIQIQNKYSYKLLEDKPFILLLSSEEDSGIVNVYSSAEDIYLFIIKLLNIDEVCIKAHPRIGAASFITPLKIRQMPSYIPIEYLNLSNCKLVIGINSIALANIASRDIKVVSIMKMMNFFSEEILYSYINYLDVNCKEKQIFYPTTIDELMKLLRNN
jgi:hypothetical protein